MEFGNRLLQKAEDVANLRKVTAVVEGAFMGNRMKGDSEV
jgi:hypothetical protein